MEVVKGGSHSGKNYNQYQTWQRIENVGASMQEVRPLNYNQTKTKFAMESRAKKPTKEFKPIQRWVPADREGYHSNISRNSGCTIS